MSLLDFVIDRQFLQTHTMAFKLPYGDPKAASLAEDLKLEFEGEFYYIKEIIKERNFTDTYLSVKANAMWYRLGERKYIGQFKLTTVTPEAGLIAILAAANLDDLAWVPGLVTDDIETYSMDTTDASYLDLLFQWAKICSCELDFHTDSERVDLLETVGGDYGLSFRYSRNMTEITRTAIPPQVTRLYAYGRNDLDIAAINPTGEEYVEDYSFYTAQGLTLPEATALYRKDEVYKDDSFVDDRSLYRAAVARLADLSQATVSYSAKVADLSAITGYAESDFGLGDRVVVVDTPLDIAVTTRVVRFVRYPYEPQRNQIELAFLPVTLPDPNIQTSRADGGLSWELFTSQNTDSIKVIRNFSTIVHQIPLEAQENAEYIVTLKLQGVGVGTCNVTVQAFNYETEEDFWPLFTFPVTDGEQIDYNFTFGQKELPAGQYSLSIRAYSDTASAGMDLPVLQSSFWVLAKGMTRRAIEFDNSRVYEYTGGVQTFEVPDDVFWVRIEAIGATGAPVDWAITIPDVTDNACYGGKVTATLPVLGGQIFDVIVGQAGQADFTSYPNGGQTNTASGQGGFSGGGSSHVWPTGGDMSTALLVAGGGGGANRTGVSRNSAAEGIGGGSAGFYQGANGNGPDGVPTLTEWGGRGATQTAGGAVGVTSNGSGDAAAGSLGQGGRASSSVGAFDFGAGGGGGGYYGGGGGGTPRLKGGGSYAGEGGGGCGFMDSTGFDLDYTDAYNTINVVNASGHGRVTISWDNPVI